jgi:hypothetical protein
LGLWITCLNLKNLANSKLPTWGTINLLTLICDTVTFAITAYIGSTPSVGQCMLVKNEGMDVMGKESSVIAPHGCCAGYEPNFDKIDDTRKGERREKLKSTDVTDVSR